MGRTRALIITATLLLLGLVAIGLIDQTQQTPAQATPDKKPSPVATATPVPSQARPEQASASLQAVPVETATLVTEQPVPDTLLAIRELGPDVEQALIVADKGMRFEMTRTLLDDVHFDELIDALDSDLVGLELQNDLLQLFYELAPTDTIAVDRLACGEKICVIRIFGPSQESLEAYVEAVSSASEGRILSRNTHDRIDAPGWIERRVVFATDQSANGFVIENPGG